jgi:hypothetical protein
VGPAVGVVVAPAVADGDRAGEGVVDRWAVAGAEQLTRAAVAITTNR